MSDLQKVQSYAKPRSEIHVGKSSPHLDGRSCRVTLLRGVIPGGEDFVAIVCFSPKAHTSFWSEPLGWTLLRMESKTFCAIRCYSVSNDSYNSLIYLTKIHSGLWESYSETPRISVFRLSEIGGESSNDMGLREGRGLYEVVCAFRSKMIVEVISLISKFL